MSARLAWIPVTIVALIAMLGGCSQTVRVSRNPSVQCEVPVSLHTIAVVSESEFYDARWTAEYDSCLVRTLESAGYEVELFREHRFGERPGALQDRAKAAGSDAILTIQFGEGFSWCARYGFGPCATPRLRLTGGESRRGIWEATLLIPVEDWWSVYDPDRVRQVLGDAVVAMQRDLRASE